MNRRVAFIVTATCLLATGVVTVVVNSREHDNRQAAQTHTTLSDTWAYTTPRGVVLMHGTRRVAFVNRFFDPSGSADDGIAWTQDRSHLAVIDDAVLRQMGQTESHVIDIDAATGARRTLPCPYCDGLTRYGLTSLAATAEDTDEVPATETFKVLDLENGTTRALDLQLPPAPLNVIGEGYKLLDSTDAATITAVPDEINGTQGTSLLLVQPGNNIQTDLDSIPRNYPGVNLAWNHGGSVTAVVTYQNQDGCPGRAATVEYTVSTREGALIRRSPLSVDLPARDKQGHRVGYEFRSITRTPDGRLLAAISTQRCVSDSDGFYKTRPYRPTGLWVLDDVTWKPSSLVLRDRPVTAVALLPSGNVITLSVPDCVDVPDTAEGVDHCNEGGLYFRVRADAPAKLVASDVLAISAPAPS